MEDPFLHINVDASTDFEELTQYFHQRSALRRNTNCDRRYQPYEEIRISIEGSLFDTSSHPQPQQQHGQENNSQIHEVTQNRLKQRQANFICLLEAILQSEQQVEKLLFDSGNVSETNSLSLQALTTVLSHAKTLKRLDLSYIDVTTSSREEFENLTNVWKDNENLLSRLSLRQCCLDRSSLAVVSSPNNLHNRMEQHQQPIRLRREKISLDPLINALVVNFTNLEWLTICSDDDASIVSTKTLTNACRAPNLRQFSLYNFDFHEENLVPMFECLSEYPSRLVRLTIPGTLTPTTAQAVSQYLKDVNSRSLEGLTLTVNGFARDNSGNKTNDEICVGGILTEIANALRVNQNLQSFRLRGCSNISGHYKQIFADALCHNYALCYFSIVNSRLSSHEDGKDAETKIQTYLKLNRFGRAQLLQHENTNNKMKWVETMIELKADLNCVFYLLSTNPSLCD